MREQIFESESTYKYEIQGVIQGVYPSNCKVFAGAFVGLFAEHSFLEGPSMG